MENINIICKNATMKTTSDNEIKLSIDGVDEMDLILEVIDKIDLEKLLMHISKEDFAKEFERRLEDK